MKTDFFKIQLLCKELLSQNRNKVRTQKLGTAFTYINWLLILWTIKIHESRSYRVLQNSRRRGFVWSTNRNNTLCWATDFLLCAWCYGTRCCSHCTFSIAILKYCCFNVLLLEAIVELCFDNCCCPVINTFGEWLALFYLCHCDETEWIQPVN